MKSEKKLKPTKKANSHRRRVTQPSQFEAEITLQLDEFFRYFNYYYPGKNKEEIINKCITGNTYWITLDSQFFPSVIDFQLTKLAQLRRKITLKNGVYPPTKDNLEEEKFILMTRRIATHHFGSNNFEELRKMPLQPLVSHLEELLEIREEEVSNQLEEVVEALARDNQIVEKELQDLGIPLIKSARLFAYQKLEKEVIQQLVNKAKRKQLQPRCDFCFTRDKQIVKCKTCSLYAHHLCFSKAPKNGLEFTCDQCAFGIQQNTQCELCPLQGGHFLQLADQQMSNNKEISKGDTSLRFKVERDVQEGKKRKFIHISCFVLHPQCSYNAKTNRVQGLHYIDRTRKNTGLCLICGNMIGMTVPCANESCRRAYHPECAKRNNLKINVIKANNKSLLEIYCQRHKKPQSYQYLNDSVSNRIKQLKRFYQSLDHEIKRHGNGHNQNRPKRQTKAEDNLKEDLCLVCSQKNNNEEQIINCRKCYGWRHKRCSKNCSICDS